MVLENIQTAAGVISTLMFISSNLPMLWKAFATKNLSSYSLGHICLSNLGNLIYWFYLFTLPGGPIWLLHGFNTLVAGLMLFGYVRYQGRRNSPGQAGASRRLSHDIVVLCVCSGSG